MKILLVGAGLANASLICYLRKKSAFKSAKYTVIDQREHLGGNCYTKKDAETGIIIHEYGPHIFNTNSDLAWSFICSNLAMHPYTNRVKVNSASGIYSFPINLHTINQFFGEKLGPAEAKTQIDELSAPYRTESPRNFEEAMLSHIGKELYEEFIHGYTTKQWGVSPSKLPASIAKRLPFRLSYDDNYYSKRYQGLPEEGYTSLFEKVFLEDDVDLRLNYAYDHAMAADHDLIVYTGAIDEYFDHELGNLSYRTVFWERRLSEGIFQGNAVINFTDIKVPYTRINEPYYFEPWKTDPPAKSIYFLEFSKTTKSTDIPFYPIRLEKDKELLNQYQSRARELADRKSSRVIFHGRLGTYQYLDMDKVIENSASLADKLETDY